MDMNKDITKLDANESIFFTRQLEAVKSQTYDVKFKPNKILSILPVSSTYDPAIEVITWRQYSKVGTAKMIADYAQDFPRVDVFGTETSVKPKDIGDSYGYSIGEIRRAAVTGYPLEQKRANVAREAIDNKLNYIALNGDTNTNLKGFLNYSGITEYTVASGGTGGTKTWSTKTAQQILDDMNGIVFSVINATNGIEIPDTLLLPMQQYNLIMTKRIGDGSDETVMSYFLKTNRYITRIEWLTELSSSGAGSTAQMYAFVNDKSHLEIEIPLMFEQFEPEKKGLAYTIPCMARTASLLVYYPLSIAKGDGI
jgi:hypothetical protein